jgi:predicted dehydrogenase
MVRNTGTGSRREFLQSVTGTVAAFTVVPRHVLGQGRTPPSEKLNIACIGITGRGGDNIKGLQGENIVALCDVDLRRAGRVFTAFPRARPYRDYRRMLDEMHKGIDAVVVSTPDHTHAVAVMAAIKRGKHVYCEKPLAHSVYEIRALMKAAHDHKVVTQLGNQGHSFDSIRRFCEWVWDGAVGNVTEVHAFCDTVHCRINDLPKLKQKQPIPPELDWELWLGPAAWRSYNPLYLPGNWRSWTPFGSGTIGDWVCHIVDPVFWALDLGAPKTVLSEAKGYDPKLHGDTFPMGTVVTFQFPARGKRGPIKLVWFDGVERPPRPAELEEGRKLPNMGAVVIGDKGKITYGSHGAGGARMIPEAKMKAYQRPAPTLPRVRDHYQDWLDAIRTGKQAGSDFAYGGPLSELAQLGIVATRFAGRPLEWDGPNMRFTNCDEANPYLKPTLRKGWTL